MSSCETLSFQHSVKFPVHFTRSSLHPSNRALANLISGEQRKALFFIDDGLNAKWPALSPWILNYCHEHSIRLVAPPHILPGGERSKDGQELLQRILNDFARLQIDRHTFVVALGGGAFLDLVGFASSICHRGLRHIRMPSTVLSQNDSGVGVKNGINLFGQKNFLGTFSPPLGVICDFDFLTTLAKRDSLAGLAEVVKVALIKDKSLFQWLEENHSALARFTPEILETAIIRCARLHMNHISQGGDPFEQGNRRPLDFGHWSAHKLEALSGYQIRHGEAVAIGMALDLIYSWRRGLLSRQEFWRAFGLLQNLGFKLWHPLLEKKDSKGKSLVLQGLEEFRIHLGGKLSLSLVPGLGQEIQVHEVDHKILLEGIQFLNHNDGKECESILTI